MLRRELAFVVLAACSGAGTTDGPTGSVQSAIEAGTPATAYPEAVVVTSSGFIPCSGVLLAPRVVLTAGHCRSTKKTYSVSAPRADGQTATGSDDWTTFDGEAATSSDTLLIFLDQDMHLASYPTIAEGPVAAGTKVVDVGRTLNGAITDGSYVSGAVTIGGTGTALGFPYNYEAQPDVSQDGDSGGPIERVLGPAHTVVAIVDTDTIEQNIDAAVPIDLFARLDVVRTDILAQIASHSTHGGAHDAGETRDAKATSRDAATKGRGYDAEVSLVDAGDDAAASSGCSMHGERPLRAGWTVGAALVVALRRRRRRRT
jgi:hypothetical protein